MQGFLYLDLSASNTYTKPVVEQVKQQLPGVAILDLDAQSDEVMLHYAKRFLEESERAVICFKAPEPEAGFGKLMPLLEELLQEQPDRLLLLLGNHTRLERIAQVRPELIFKKVQDQEELLREMRLYFLG